MSISQRKDNKSWQYDTKDVTGKRLRKSGFKTKKEAELALAQVTVNNGKGLSNVVDKKITMADACIDFLDNYVENHCKTKTKYEYKGIIKKKIIPFFNNKKLIDITQDDIEQFIKYLRTETITKNFKNNKIRSNATINKYITLIGSIIDKQVKKDKIFKNVAKKVQKLKTPKAKSRALTVDETKILLETCKTVKPEFYPMLYTVLNTGLRRGEAVALKWENINLKNNTIHVTHSELNGKECEPKTETSKRYINIPSCLRKILLEQKLISNGSEYVFPNTIGEMYRGNHIYERYFIPVMKACNIGHFCFKDLRHTYGSQLIENGASYKYVQEQMGHSSPDITLGIYNHILPQSKERAMNILEDIYAVS